MGNLISRQFFRRFYPHACVPRTGRQHSDLVEKLIDSSQQVTPSLCFVRHLTEDLELTNSYHEPTVSVVQNHDAIFKSHCNVLQSHNSKIRIPEKAAWTNNDLY